MIVAERKSISATPSLSSDPLKKLYLFGLITLLFGVSFFFQACDTPSKERSAEDSSTLYVKRIQGKLHFRVGNRIYSEDSGGEINLDAKAWVPSQKDNWDKIMDFGSKNETPARLFSFRQFSKSDDALLIIETRPQLLKEYTSPFPSYVLFRYSESSEEHKLNHLLTFSRPLRGGYYVAKIDRFSPNEKHVSLNLYTCWSCAREYPNKVLLDLESLVVKDIGQVSYFKWDVGSNYEYKEFIEKDCFEDASGTRYKCPEDPANLPTKKGTFDIETLV
jgi:hypothetical protein